MTGLLALGDSFTCGEGVGVRIPTELTWTGLLCEALADPTRELLAAPGARVRDVVHAQLPRVVDATVATLIIGLNDVVRGGYDAGRFTADLLRSVELLCVHADMVLLGRLHDPLRLLWVPQPLRRRIRQRVSEVNDAVDEASGYPRVHVLDLDTIDALQHQAGWAVDRVHPSAWGHAALAEAAGGILRQAGCAVIPRPVGRAPRRPSAIEQAWWFSRHGIPYAATNVKSWGLTT